MKKLLAVMVPGILMLGAPLASPGAAPAGLLPYDRTNPVWSDNDYTNDYIDWYLMVLASAGDISYRGITTSSSIDPYNRHMPSATFDWCVQDRAGIVQKGRNSGFRNVPNSAAGTKGHLVKPASGRIEDTVPINSAGIQSLLAQARQATAAQPLVVCMGGPVTAASSAYLLDPSIADKMVVVSLDMPDGFYSFNGWSDGWAAYIALTRLRLVHFGFHSSMFPRLSKTWIQNNLPDSPAKTHMLSLDLDVVNGSDGDADGITAVSVRRPDFVQAVKRVSFGGWRIADGHEVPMFRDDPAGRAIVVTQASGTVATQEYQRAFTNPAAWSSTPPPPTGGSGTGLKGDYFDNVDFTNFKFTRTDPTVNFDWQAGSPASSIAPDTFSARWTGQVEAPASGGYTFFVNVDDAVKLWVNGQLIINSTTAYSGEIGASIALTGGQKVPIQMEMAEWGGYARAILRWSGPGIGKQVVPQSRLYPAAGSTTPPPPSAAGPVAYWRFDETAGTSASDASGQGNTGTLLNGPAWWTAGKVGGALRFDGVNDYVRVSDSASLSSPSGQFSAAAWFYRAADKGHWQCLVTRQLGSSWDDQYILGFYENSYRFGVHTTAGFPVAAGPRAPLSQWVHVAGTYDGGSIRLYVNGGLIGSVAASGTLLRDGRPLLIGGGHNDATGAASETFNGWIDDVRIYNRALSAAEVQGLYNGGAGTSVVK